MTTRLMLISPAMNQALREARFPHTEEPDGHTEEPDGDGPVGDELDALGLREAEAVRETFPATATATATTYVSPSLRCRRTAEALGLDAKPLPALAPCAMGRWQGRTLDEVAAAEPDALASWLADPAAAPHGGEPLLALLARAAHWLDTLGEATASDSGTAGDGASGGGASGGGASGSGAPGSGTAGGRVIAVAEPDIIRACAVHSLGATPAAFWRIDVRPLTATELSGRVGRWNLLSGRPLHSVGPRPFAL
ncbi:histidine phosphatase family protein [Streptomyces scopuliridis]|uniref:Histidine phosphatase family protein n=1 Tax=Streptomyces scopuliridis TaxID=452529 RepID=A0ACD4ZKG0_9ACTN|nr:histidine phosphatase family protein [Streptomyces scopuliridis]WSB98501.1 histidine phosphatase family protein [Streptomyces scopuliridis]WSC07797.1 histidine phosphatase family protein [Streptomyces scopuliridis]